MCRCPIRPSLCETSLLPLALMSCVGAVTSGALTRSTATQTDMHLFSLYFQMSHSISRNRTQKLTTMQKTGGASPVEKLCNQIWKARMKGKVACRTNTEQAVPCTTWKGDCGRGRGHQPSRTSNRRWSHTGIPLFKKDVYPPPSYLAHSKRSEMACSMSIFFVTSLLLDS